METIMTKVTKQMVLGHEVSVLGTIEEPLFRAQDIADWLNLGNNTTQMIRSVPSSEVKKVVTNVGISAHNVTYLTEFGVYFVLMRSKKPQAEIYQRKIMEILKSIRLKGYAVSDNISEEQVSKLVQDAKDKAKLIKVQGDVIKVDDRFIASLKRLIALYEDEKSKVAEIVADDLF